VRRGFTLIEVIAALMIVGGLMAALVVSRAQLHRQMKSAELQREAVRVADDLLTRSWEKTGTLAAGESGTTRDGNWQWKTEWARSPSSESIPGRVVRLDVWRDATRISLEVLTREPASDDTP
jgi:prepilin-type N-terminal cleavage/methylation domain-containing protein